MVKPSGDDGLVHHPRSQIRKENMRTTDGSDFPQPKTKKTLILHGILKKADTAVWAISPPTTASSLNATTTLTIIATCNLQLVESQHTLPPSP